MDQGLTAGSSLPQTHSVCSHTTGLSIQKCDFMIPENNKNHHTEEISTGRLIVRRGQPFTITVSFSAPVHNYLQQMKKTFLIVQTGSAIANLPGLCSSTHLKNRAGAKAISRAGQGCPGSQPDLFQKRHCSTITSTCSLFHYLKILMGSLLVFGV